MSDVKYSALDPGIREVVRLLRGWGFDTTDSGDGVTKPLDFEGVLRIPHVHCVHDLADDVFEAARFMREHLLALGLTDEHFQVQVLFDPCPGNDGLTISLFNLNDETLATVKP